MSEKLEIWEIIESKKIADCKVFRVREDLCKNSASRKTANFFVVENPDWVNIIALTDNDQVVLIEQYRQGSQEVTLEIPGGMIDPEEEPLNCAERELLEETGFVAKEMTYIGKSRPNPAIQSNWIYHYFARDCKKTGETKFDEHESIRTKLVNFEDLDSLIETEKITHSLVLAGFYRLKQFLLNQTLES